MDYDGEKLEQDLGMRDDVFKRCGQEELRREQIRNSDTRGELIVESL